MRESLNHHLIPISQSSMMSGIEFNTSSRNIVNVSSNGYYGYQPQLYTQQKDNSPVTENIEVDNEMCDIGVQFNNLNQNEDMQIENSIMRHMYRKRRWEFGDELCEPKKRRQNDGLFSCPMQQQHHQSPPKSTHLRKPTHNIPDLPRCNMEIKDGSPRKVPQEDKDSNILEELLRETHGVYSYQWFSDEI